MNYSNSRPGLYYNQSGSYNQHSQSPYLMSIEGNVRGNNAVNIIRRSKNYLDEVKNSNSGYQVRLPQLSKLNRNSHENYM